MEFLYDIFNRIVQAFGLGKFDTSYLLMYFSVLAFALLVEWKIVGWKNSTLYQQIRSEGSARNDGICWLLQFFRLNSVFGLFLTFGICYYLVGRIQNAFQLDLVLNIPNPFLQFMIVFLAADLKNYVRHSAFHRFGSLWALHAFHHSSTSLNIFTRYRDNFIETSISRFFDVIPFIIFGAPVETYLLVKIINETQHMFLHSAIRSDWGWIGRYILVSPAAHRIHHSVEPRHYNKNMGSTFIFWDRMFGTYHPAEEVEEVGIPDNPYNRNGFVRDIWHGVKAFLVSLFNALISLVTWVPRGWNRLRYK